MICRISTPVGGASPLSRHRHFRHGLNELSVSKSLSVQVYTSFGIFSSVHVSLFCILEVLLLSIAVLSNLI